MLAEWAPIYEACAQRGLGQGDVDEMELWVVAQILGLNRSDDRMLTESEHRASAADLNRQRVLAAAGQAPEPTFEPTGPIIDDAAADDMLAHLRAARAARKAAQGA